MSKESRVWLTAEQAISMLADGDTIHTMSAGPVHICANWDRDDAVEHIRNHRRELAGPLATKAGYGLAVWDVAGPLFFRTHNR